MSVRNNIVEKFEGLLEKQTMETISVSAICKECGISRKTFYVYFKDKYDLLDYIFVKDILYPIRRMTYTMNEHEISSRKTLEQMYDTFLSKKMFYMNAIKTTGQNSFYDLITERIMQMNVEMLTPSIKDDIEREYVSYFFASAQANLLRKWFHDDMVVPPKKMAEFYDDLAVKAFETLRRTYSRR